MQQITRGDYLEDLITIYIENNLQTDLTDLYEKFVFQCGDIQKFLTPAQVIKISFNEQESQLLKTTNTCYLAGITTDGHKETFNGSLTFNTRGEVVFYEPPVSTVIPTSTSTDCGCQGLRGFFGNCSQPAIKAYFSLNYVPTKVSELQNDADYQDGLEVAASISIHNTSTEAHPYIQGLITDEASIRAGETEALGVRIDNEVSTRASQTEALSISIGAETTAREEAVSLAITTTEAYTDTHIASATTAINTTIGTLASLTTTSTTDIVSAINSEVSDRQNADSNLQNQIDGLAAASDVKDIVGTYADLENYDTSHLGNNDIIKVLTDETHSNQPSYYRYDKDTDTFSYIGSESAAYTKAQSDSIFVTQTTTVNNKPLSSDITLSASDVGALASTTTITNLASTTQMAAINSGVTTTAVAQVGTNTTDISTINGKIPTDASSSNKLVSASTLSASIADFANKDINNLTLTGEARLHALKGYKDEGELLTDAEGLQDVIDYAHSTFCGTQASNASPLDNKKFIKQGSPIITNDGIMTTNDSVYYVKVPIIIDWSKPFDIDLYLDNIKYSSTSQYLLSFDGVTAEGLLNALFLSWTNENNYSIGTNIQDTYNVLATGSIASTQTHLFVQFKYDGTKYYIKYKSNEADEWTTVSVTSGKVIPHTQNLIVGTGIYRQFRGSIDLKQFSITVDGIPVFSGNKTGVDTIKADDYTPYTDGTYTATVTEDGILKYNSNLSSVYYNRILCTLPSISANDSWRMETYVNLGSISSDSTWLFQCYPATADNGFRIRIKSQKLLFDAYKDDNSGWLFTNATTTYTLSANKSYLIVVEKVANAISISAYENGEILTGSQTWTAASNFKGILSTNYSYAIPYEDSTTDLNRCKFYLNGSLVYQPCLKIPYTESKTGSKIANSIYRPRVNDMYAQFGYADYYTLLEEDTPHYSVVGSPTISSDWVASGFSASNYLTASAKIQNSTNWEINLAIKLDSLNTGNWLLSNNDLASNFGLVVSSDNKIKAYISGSGLTDYSVQMTSTNSITTQLTYIRLKQNGTTIKLFSSLDGINYTEEASATSSIIIGVNNWAIGVRKTTGYDIPLQGSIDLKSFKIYVDNKLAYQAVESPDYTLPQGEVYGLIERQNFAPSDKYDELTLGASGSTYTAPADGWFMVNKAIGATTDNIRLINNINGLAVSGVDSNVGSGIRAFLPVKKNDVITITYTATGTTNYFRFIYSVGSESEAK